MVFVHPVAIKPYLKRYLAYYCKIEPEFVINQDNRFASFLLNSLRHKTSLEVIDKKYRIEHSEELLIRIPEYYSTHHGINISLKQQYWFNKFVQEEFLERMMTVIVPNLTGKKGEIKTQLNNFRLKYNITEDDLPYKTLEKMWERNRERIPLYQQN